MKQKTIEEIAEFLKEIYIGGFGIDSEIGKISAWYSNDGIKLAKGESAQYISHAQIISWKEAALQIYEMLDKGIFLTEKELNECPNFERKELAQKLIYLYDDFNDRAKKTSLLETIKNLKSWSFDEQLNELTDILKNESYVAVLKDQFDEFLYLYSENRDILRFHYRDCKDIKKRLDELFLPRIQFHSSLHELPSINTFITDDEINMDLLQGSGFQHGKNRIYDFFKENRSNQERALYLKKEYGIGGHSHALSRSDFSFQRHDAKGITYTKNNCKDITLSWKQVAKKIDYLISTEHYKKEIICTPEEETEEVIEDDYEICDLYDTEPEI
ncbi:hypothetical protein H6A03_01120 [[Clostridium] spiroforme]|nr:hypothetical protein [Thomasclavelia spiroformis]